MRNIRISLLMIVLALIAVGIIMIYSSTAIYSWEKFNDSGYFIKRHIVFLSVGLILSVAIMFLDYHILFKHSKKLVILAILMLAVLLLPGISREISGAKRWFRILGLSFQPSEFANIAVIIYVASFLSSKPASRKNSLVFGFFPPMAVLGIIDILVLMQPDLGTVVALSMVVFIMIFVAGYRMRYLLYVMAASMPALYLLIFRVPYRRARIMSFLNPWADPLGSGFQLIQSQVALGSGGLFGRGMGKGMQKLFYLPAGHTDFIFSIIGEELGIIAAIFVLFLFILLFIQGSRIAAASPDNFGSLLSLGLVLLLGLKAFINIGVSTGIFPTKGLPLPFISYGGSALVFDMASIALLLNVARFGQSL